MLTVKQVIRWLNRYADALDANKVYLTKLDADIGDADHGVNMTRGFKAVRERLDSLEGSDLGTIFKQTGTALVSSVGGAAGPLYGTLFMEAGKVVDGNETVEDQQLVDVFDSGLEGVMRRGKSEPGQKTMIDSLKPARDALEDSIKNNADTISALQAASEAAYQGMKDTIPMVAKKGRASYLGERSKGHQDPGATSTYLMVKTLYEASAGLDDELILEEARGLGDQDIENLEASVEE